MKHKIIISLKSNDHLSLSNGQKKIQLLFKKLHKNKDNSFSVALPNQRSYITVLRSPHIDKKSREQFIYKTSKMNISFTFQDTADLNLFIFALNQIEIPGVEMKIITKEWKYIAF